MRHKTAERVFLACGEKDLGQWHPCSEGGNVYALFPPLLHDFLLHVFALGKHTAVTALGIDPKHEVATGHRSIGGVTTRQHIHHHIVGTEHTPRIDDDQVGKQALNIHIAAQVGIHIHMAAQRGREWIIHKTQPLPVSMFQFGHQCRMYGAASLEFAHQGTHAECAAQQGIVAFEGHFCLAAMQRGIEVHAVELIFAERELTDIGSGRQVGAWRHHINALTFCPQIGSKTAHAARRHEMAYTKLAGHQSGGIVHVAHIHTGIARDAASTLCQFEIGGIALAVDAQISTQPYALGYCHSCPTLL